MDLTKEVVFEAIFLGQNLLLIPHSLILNLFPFQSAILVEVCQPKYLIYGLRIRNSIGQEFKKGVGKYLGKGRHRLIIFGY